MDPCILPIIYLINHVHYNPHSNKYMINKIAKNVCFYSQKRDLDPILVTAIIAHESGFRSKLKSNTQDVGLMQLHEKYVIARCDLLKVRCNIKKGTRLLSRFKKAGDLNGNHWLRRYNWLSRRHHLRVLWIRRAFKLACNGHKYLFEMIKQRRYQRIRKLSYECIRKDLCGQLRMEEKS